MPGEFEFIDWIRTQQRAGGRVLTPAGDDLAVLKWAGADLLLVGVDQVLDGVHFDSRTHTPEQIGKKAMNRNLSDCAAMACLPAAAVVSVALPRGSTADYAKRLYLGVKNAGDRFECPIVGGDTASWDGRLCVSVTVFGRSAGVMPVLRRGAEAGDALYTTGPLGGSILGRHIDFVPRVAEARLIAATGLATAMMDLSDGLSRDAGHLGRESGVGIEIDAALVPIHPDVVRLAADGHAPLMHALGDGEDYELLFTAKPGSNGLGTRIGRVVAGQGVWLVENGQRRPLPPSGWEHTL